MTPNPKASLMKKRCFKSFFNVEKKSLMENLGLENL